MSAKVSDSFAVQTNIVHVDGKRATYLAILKHADASTLAVVDAARDMLPEIQAAAPKGMELKLDFDQSVFVRAAVDQRDPRGDHLLHPGLADDPAVPGRAGATP